VSGGALRVNDLAGSFVIIKTGMRTFFHRRRPERRQRGFSLVELLIVIAIILIILAIAIPRLDKARMHTQEMAAIRQIGTVHTAQTQYYSQFGKFAQNLGELGPPTSGQEGPAAAGLIPTDLALGTKSGYRFTITGTPTGYQVNANPVTYNGTGRRSFYSDQTLVIRENWGAEPATGQSPEIK
jgi:prepilin-type N-terminal cleavage/methylation domain-containing protein